MLIGLTGPSGSYKTQVAKHLERAHGFARIHAGRPVKKGLRAGFDMTREQMRRAGKDQPTMMLGGAAPRDMLEGAGAAYHQAAPHATSVVLERRVAKRVAQGKHVVVDGVRSPVEAETLQRMGGHIVRCDNGKPLDPEKPMDRMQAQVKSSATIDTSSSKKADRKIATDYALSDLRNCNT
jgi:dephospho-CoA kinase